eukprot:gnl/Spiro4/14648_TR7890_c0_g1_i1.p1 gnl/Spiro4/14648_TR7890_c0_g1~~gnl/Spiro4/14648_TR7890_c0_g1_i1.p1  ORF type:complete len:606 (+),score=152.23 gnl/Spiro4/14648_TR7890_c0_g1_i1:187-1818(+)
MRLWGPEGQDALEDSSVCLLNCSGTGVEILKNLILPGIRDFSCVDDVMVTEADLGNNFFVEPADIGKPRAAVVATHLGELNPNVAYSHHVLNVVRLIHDRPAFFAPFSVVIATQLPNAAAVELARICSQHGIHLVLSRLSGLVGYFRIYTNELHVIQPKPDNPVHDLCLSNPFPELLAYVNSVDLERMDPHDLGSVPYAVILIKFLTKWKADHGGLVPQSDEDKDAFKESIGNFLERVNHIQWEGLTQVEVEQLTQNSENFFEAVTLANKCWRSTNLPSDVTAAFADPACLNLTADSHPFWVVVRALKDFVENEGQGRLPLIGSIPDMTATTINYITLQTIYKRKAEADLNVIQERVAALLRSLGRSETEVPREYLRGKPLYLKRVVSCAHYMSVSRYRTVEQELSPNTMKKSDYWGMRLQWYGPTAAEGASWYLAFQAVEEFYAAHGRYPGLIDAQYDQDMAAARVCLHNVLAARGIDSGLVEDKYVDELVRSGMSEQANIAGVIGGMASQEAIKLITRQMIPLNNVHVYSGISCSGTTYEV